MAMRKLADFVRWLNDEYDAGLTYQRAYMATIAGRIPAERDVTGRFWEIDEANYPAAANALGLVAAKPKATPVAKTKPAVTAGKYSRSSSRRPAA